MARDGDQATTQMSVNQAELRVEDSAYETVAIPALTIVYHPELRRIGDRVLLSELLVGRTARISRNVPTFSPPRQHRGDPLSEPHISRRPIEMRMAESGGVVVSVEQSRTKVSIAGEPVSERREVSSEAMQRGVMVELAERVLLLLHWHTPPHSQETGDMGLVGDSTAIVTVRDEIRRVADLDVTVLIRGETGAGKELVAAAIHESSPDRDPLVSVNMAAIPASLAAAELFGAARGAYTGAARGQEGYFRRAHGGTLFLDEIGEVPIDVQIMLLRALETGEVYPLGAQRPEQIDARVIAATDGDLEAMVEAGTFRGPLLHRLAGYDIWVPPLRERRDDIGRLLLYFLGLDLTEFGETDRLDQSEPAPWLPLSVMRHLVTYDWPGNVRQLRNVARQLVIGNRGRPVAKLTPQLLRQLTGSAASDSLSGERSVIGAGERAAIERAGGLHASAQHPDEARPASRPMTRASSQPEVRKRRPAEISEAELAGAMQRNRWDLKATAKELGISRTSLYALIKNSTTIRTAGDLDAAEITACHGDCSGDLDAMADCLQVSKQALRRRVRELGLS